MYYLRKEPQEMIIPEMEKADGTIIQERRFMSEDRAIYKHSRLSRFYRGEFKGIDGRYQGMKVYKCKTLKHILDLRDAMQAYCGEVFDVYNDNGKAELLKIEE